jgi:hypothetical protein
METGCLTELPRELWGGMSYVYILQSVGYYEYKDYREYLANWYKIYPTHSVRQ